MLGIQGTDEMDYRNLQVVERMQVYSQMQDEVNMGELLDDMLKIKHTPEGTKEVIEEDVYKGFVFFAENVDLELSSKTTSRYNKTMDLANKVFFKRGLDIGDYKTYEYAIADPKLN